jgi:hypothetical protein
MAPTRSKRAPQKAQPELRKRQAPSDSNASTKHLKLSSQSTSVNHRQRQSTVEEVEDEESTSMNSSPQNPNVLLEAANGSDDVEMSDNPSPSQLQDFEEDDEPEESLPVETAEEQRSELIKS